MTNTMNITMQLNNGSKGPVSVPIEEGHTSIVHGKAHYLGTINSIVAMQCGVECNEEQIDWSQWPDVVVDMRDVTVEDINNEYETMRQEEAEPVIIPKTPEAEALKRKLDARKLLGDMGIKVSNTAYDKWRTNTLIDAARAVASAYDAGLDVVIAYNEAYNKQFPGNNHVVGTNDPNVVVTKTEEPEGTEGDDVAVETHVETAIVEPEIGLRIAYVDGKYLILDAEDKPVNCDISILNDHIEKYKMATAVRTSKIKQVTHELKAHGLIVTKEGHVVHETETHMQINSALTGTMTEDIQEVVDGVVYDKKEVKTPKGRLLYTRWYDTDGVLHVAVDPDMVALALKKFNTTHTEETCVCGESITDSNRTFSKKLAPVHPKFTERAYCKSCQEHIILTGNPRANTSVVHTGTVKYSFT